MDLKNIISHVEIEAKRATIFPGEPLVHRMRQPFIVEYDADIDLREMDLSMVITPFLLNVIPLLWFMGRTYKVNSMDEDLFSSLELVRNGFRTLYPDVSWEGQLIPENLVSNPGRENNTDLSQVLFFSGGVDSTYSALQADPDRTMLLTVRGHDIALDNDQAWKTVCGQVNDFASRTGFRTARVSANVFGLLRCGDIHKMYPFLKPWYGTVQHGLGLSGLGFPLAVYNGWDRVIFSSSEGVKAKHVPWGAHHFLEPNIRVAGVEIFSEGAELIWSDKVSVLVDIFRQNPALKKPFLRVCLDEMKGNAIKNCGSCEKCLRGIMSFILKYENPADWGIPSSRPLFKALKRDLPGMYIPPGCVYIWDHINYLVSKVFPESEGDNRDFFRWFIDWYGSRDSG